MQLTVSGGKDLLRLADRFRDAGNKKLSQQLDRGLRRAAEAIGDAVKGASDPYIPRGFERTFASSLEYRVEVRLAHAGRVSVVFFAKGRKGFRHLDQIEAGRLAHPVHGRFRRLKSGRLKKNPWVKPPQRIRSGVITEPGFRAVPLGLKRINAEVKKVTDQI